VLPRALSGSGSWIRTNDLRVMSPTSYRCSIPRRVLGLYQYDSLRSKGGVALAPAYCPGQLPAEYRRRWGVSRPCSGRERVGPPRGDTRTKAPCLCVSPCGRLDAGSGLLAQGRSYAGEAARRHGECVGVRKRSDPVGLGSCMREVMSRSAISTARLKPLRAVHRPPINQVVYLGPYPV
jgi:hypothetical protein